MAEIDRDFNALRPTSGGNVQQRAGQVLPDQVREILPKALGPWHGPDGTARVQVIGGLTAKAALCKPYTRPEGRSIGHCDTTIAGDARSLRLVLITVIGNIGDFCSFAGMRLAALG